MSNLTSRAQSPSVASFAPASEHNIEIISLLRIGPLCVAKACGFAGGNQRARNGTRVWLRRRHAVVNARAVADAVNNAKILLAERAQCSSGLDANQRVAKEAVVARAKRRIE